MAYSDCSYLLADHPTGPDPRLSNPQSSTLILFRCYSVSLSPISLLCFALVIFQVVRVKGIKLTFVKIEHTTFIIAILIIIIIIIITHTTTT